MESYTRSSIEEGNDGGSPTRPPEIEIPARIQSTRQSIFGRIRKCENISILEWGFIALSMINILFGLCFSIYRLASLTFMSNYWIFSFLVTINLLFAIYYLFHGIFQEQVFEVIMLIFTTLFIWSLLTINFAAYGQSETEISPKIKLIRFILTSIMSLPNIIFAFHFAKKYWASGNLIFRTVGGDMKLQKMCRILLFGFSLLVFDSQAFISCLILFTKGDDKTSDNIVVFIGGLMFEAIWVLIGYVAMRSENLDMTWLFGILSICQPLYALYLFVQVFWIINGPYTVLTISIFVSGISFLISHFILLAMLPVISYNYGKGLRTKIYGVQPQNQRPHNSNSTEPLLTSRDERNYDAIVSQ